MDLTTTFDDLAGQWSRHCEQVAYSSNMSDRFTHPAFQQLIDLGPDSVPLMIRRLADDSDGCPWEFVLQELTGVRFLRDPDRFDLSSARRQRLDWWESRQNEGAADRVFS